MSDAFNRETLDRIQQRDLETLLARLGVSGQVAPGVASRAGGTVPQVNGLTVSGKRGNVTVRWNDVAFLPRVRYRVEMSTSPGFSGSITVQTFNDHLVWTEDLEVGTTYYVRVRAEAGAAFAQTGSWSAVLSLSVPEIETDELDSNVVLASELEGKSVTITIYNPTTDVDFPVWFGAEARTISALRCVVVGSSSPSVTIDPQHCTDNGGTLNDVLTSATAVTNTGTGATLSSFDDPTMPANSWFRMKITAVSGTPKSITVTVFYELD